MTEENSSFVSHNRNVSIPGLRPPERFSPGDNPAESWKLFKQRWSSFYVLSDLSAQPNQIQIALF